jgi:hypothetical protein
VSTCTDSTLLYARNEAAAEIMSGYSCYEHLRGAFRCGIMLSNGTKANRIGQSRESKEQFVARCQGEGVEVLSPALTIAQVFDDPDFVCSSEYRTVYDLLVDVNEGIVGRSGIITEDSRDHLVCVMEELIDRAESAKRTLQELNLL